MAEVSVSKFSRFINLLRELSVNWGDHSSGEPEHIWLVRWSSCQSWGCPRTSGDPNQRIFGVFSSSPQDWWRTCQCNRKINFRKSNLLLSRWRQVTTFSSTKWGFPLEPKPPLNTSLLSEDGGRSLEMRGEEGFTPTYVLGWIGQRKIFQNQF